MVCSRPGVTAVLSVQGSSGINNRRQWRALPHKHSGEKFELKQDQVGQLHWLQVPAQHFSDGQFQS